jgi:hypothetical protein
MPRTLLLLLFTLFSLSAFAQPTLTSNSFPEAGDVVITWYAAGDVDPGPAGPNQTWNFTDLILITPEQTDQYLPAAATPYAATFANANLAALAVGELYDSVYSYYRRTPSEFNYLGYQLNGVYLLFTDPELLVAAPLAFGATVGDQFARYSTLPDNSIQGNGAKTMTYDAYGTLTTPAGTFQDAMRLTTLRGGRDTTWLFAGYLTRTYSDTLIEWYVADKPGPRFAIHQLGESVTYYLPGQPPNTQPYATTTLISFAAATTPTDEPDPAAARSWQLELLGANPAADRLAVQIRAATPERAYELTVLDAQGRMIYREQAAANTAIEVPAGAWAPGSYYVRVSDGRAVQNLTWVKGI